MNNNILGLSIDRASQGLTNLITINGDKSWTTHVRDIRKELENVENLNVSSAALMLTCIDTGHLLTLGSWIEGRGGDYISAWIYVPASINIMGKDLVNVIEIVKQEILADRRDDDRLREVFAKTYALAEAKKITVQSSGEKYAYRCYGSRAKYTLAELLSEMFQPCYKNYKRVVLIDNATSHKCVAGDDLSSQKVLPMIVISAPGVVDNFVPHTNNEIFDKSICAIEGDELLVEWKRPGYSTIKKQLKAVKDVKCPVPTRNEYQVIVKRSQILVKNENGNIVEKYELIVNGKLETADTFLVSESEISKSNVQINAEGYDPGSKVLDLRTGGSIEIKRKTLCFYVIGYDGAKIEFNYSTKRELTTSPLMGYVVNGFKDKQGRILLDQKPLFSLKTKFVLALVMVVMLALGSVGTWFLKDWLGYGETIVYVTKPAKVDSTTDMSPDKEKETPRDWSKIVKYLDEHSAWNRTEMEELGAVDLWDYLNEYQFDDILIHMDELNGSKCFAELFTELEKGKNATELDRFNSENDFVITFEKYLNRIKSLDSNTEGKDGPQGVVDNNKQ